MRVVVLEYHDVVEPHAFEASGFSGASANSYKVTIDAFRAHLAAVAAAGCPVLNDVRGLPNEAPRAVPVLFSFDDGGSSSLRSAELLEARGWRGHYFIATSCIGTPGFLTAAELRELHGRGHVVGSHSHSHPLQMGRMTPAIVHDEWARSVAILEDVLGAPADVASVPGGYYRPFLAEAASACGVRWLLSSEPVRRVHRVADAYVLGRYTIRRADRAAHVRSLTASPSLARALQWTMWNAKKVAKRVGGDAYLRLRAAIFRETSYPAGDRRPRG